MIRPWNRLLAGPFLHIIFIPISHVCWIEWVALDTIGNFAWTLELVGYSFCRPRKFCYLGSLHCLWYSKNRKDTSHACAPSKNGIYETKMREAGVLFGGGSHFPSSCRESNNKLCMVP